jgi:hypothetical protein
MSLLPVPPQNWTRDWQDRFGRLLDGELSRRRKLGDIELQRETISGATRDEGLYLWGADDLRYELRDFLRLRQREVSGTTDTLTVADEHYVIKTTSGSATTVTVPTNANEPFPVRSLVHFFQYGAGLLTIAGDTGVTVRYRTGLGLKSAGQYAMFSVWKFDTNEWVLFGDISA